jgi:enamine deaminase RidA (YjgF/YER057c/UK114 family)
VERKVINPWTWQDQFGFVQAHEVTGPGRTLFCAGQTSTDADGNPLHEGDMPAQMNQALENLETVLRQAGFELSHVVRLNTYTTNVDAFIEAVEPFTARLAEAGCRPSATLIGVERLAFPEFLIEFEATAVK